MYLYKKDNFFPINHYFKSVSKVALLHRYCIAEIKVLQNTVWKTVAFLFSRKYSWKKFDTLVRFSAAFYKGDNFCDFVFLFLHTKSLLKKGLL